MGKQTKRSRKFESSGGVKARLDKGTITKKGKLKRTKRSGGGSGGPSKAKEEEQSSYSRAQEQKRRDGDLTSQKNLGDLDLDAFFSTFEQQQVLEEEDAQDMDVAHEESEEDGSDEDDEGDEEEISDPEDDDEKEEDPEDDDDDDDDDDKLDDEPDELDQTHHMKASLVEKKDNDDDGSDIPKLTIPLLSKLEKEAFKLHKIKGLKKIVSAYRSACYMANADDEKVKGKQAYRIESLGVFNRLMLVTLQRSHEELRHHLLKNCSKESDDQESEFDENKPISPKQLERCPKWTSLKSCIQSILRSTMHLLSEAKEPKMLSTVLSLLSSYVPYATPFPRVAESLLKLLTSLWSAPADASEDYQVVRLHAFLRIRQLALTQPFPFIEECLKKLYLAYAQRAKFATAASVSSLLPTLTFLGNCIVELYSIDFHSSYQHAFIYIRQLALHLRTAMQKQTEEAFGTVYCWQYLHCLKLWSAVLAAACQSTGAENGDEQLMRSLLFPLSQVIIGAARLIPSPRYLPFRLHCVRLLQQLAASAEVFLPTTSFLLDALDLKELYQHPKKSPKEQVQPIALTFRLNSDNPLRFIEEMEMCVSEVFVLMNQEVDLYQFSGGFPEFTVRISQRLRKFVKETRNNRWKTYAKGSIDLCDRYSKKALVARAKINDVAPKDIKQLEVLRPINAPSMGERYRAAIEKERRLEAVNRPAMKQDKSSPSAPVEKKNKKASKKRKAINEPKSSAKANLDEDDKVEEGINWSDDDE